MMSKAANIFTSISYGKVLALSVLMIVLGIGFGGLLLPKIIRQAMRMVKTAFVSNSSIDFRISIKRSNLYVIFSVQKFID